MTKTYAQAVRKFLKTADWLTDDDAPMVTGLINLAKELDNSERFHAQTYAQYGLTFRYLAKRKPVETETLEEDGDLEFS